MRKITVKDANDYIGVNDKNGKKIYDGDFIVRDGFYVEKIVWDRGSYHAELVSINGDTSHAGSRGQVYDNLKYWKEQGVEVCNG